ncbi:MAG: hypothetical protein HYV09_16905 [Deltaproteobacteria bacterium]|nr:hypothetical protein [Deltaproteobacteria bacterium]
MRRKLSPRPLARATSSSDGSHGPGTPKGPARAAGPTRYAAVLAKARALGLFTVVTIAPLGLLAGSVSACGAAAPVKAHPQPGGVAPPLETIEPPAATAPPPSSTDAPAPSGGTPAAQPAPGDHLE